jgi:hypothetical protein
VDPPALRQGRPPEAIRTALPDVALTAASAGEDVHVSGALSFKGESGGGLNYQEFVARLCLLYSVEPTSGSVTISYAPCPASADAQVPSGETASLAD